MVKLLVKDNIFQHLGLYIAGPSELKKQIQDEQLFVQHFQKHLKQVFTISEIHEQSVYEVITKIKPNEHVDDFELILQTQSDLLVFGPEVFEQLEIGELQQLFIDNDSIHLLDPFNVDKLKIIVMDKAFKKKYDIVGLRYYNLKDYYNSEDEI